MYRITYDFHKRLLEDFFQIRRGFMKYTPLFQTQHNYNVLFNQNYS